MLQIFSIFSLFGELTHSVGESEHMYLILLAYPWHPCARARVCVCVRVHAFV